MTLEQKNEKSGGVSEKTGSFMVWLRREKRRWLAGSMQRGKKMALLLPLSGEEQTLFWLLLWPLVISEILWKFHFRASKWKTVYSRRSTRTEDIFLSKDFSSSSVFLSRYMTWPTAICDKQWIQYSTKDENRKNVPWQGKKSPVWKSQSFFFCDLLNCLRSVWQRVFLSIQTSMSALLIAPVTISVSTLLAVSSASVIKATSSTALHTVEVSQHVMPCL